MKNLWILLCLVALSFIFVFPVRAQTQESMWLQAVNTVYKTNETVILTLNGISATPIQGFTAQIRYDPDCLQPINGVSPISGMNGLAVPQDAGMTDVSFASTAPQLVNGVLVELHFAALKSCQTVINIETAAFVIRNESGFAVPVSGVNVNKDPVAIIISSAVGTPESNILADGVLPLAPSVSSDTEQQAVHWWTVGMIALAIIPIIFIFIALYKLLKPPSK